MSVLKAVIDTPTLQVIEPAPRIQVTVASGLDGRRGSYMFAGSLLDPSTAISYMEITQSPDIIPFEYDMFTSTIDGSIWHYRYNGSGQLYWAFISRPETIQVLKSRYVVPNDHGALYELVHNRGTLDVDVILYRNVTPFVSVSCFVERTSVNKVTLRFGTEPTPTELVAIVIAYM